MGLFARTPTGAKLRGHKTVKINGWKFVIKKVNPFVDFQSDRLPLVFSGVSDSAAPKEEEPKTSEGKAHQYERMRKGMSEMILAGVVEPEIAPAGESAPLTVDDLFRDPSVGVRLYYAIIDHSLNKFKGMSNVFFSLAVRLWYSTLCANGTVNGLQVSRSPAKT